MAGGSPKLLVVARIHRPVATTSGYLVGIGGCQSSRQQDDDPGEHPCRDADDHRDQADLGRGQPRPPRTLPAPGRTRRARRGTRQPTRRGTRQPTRRGIRQRTRRSGRGRRRVQDTRRTRHTRRTRCTLRTAAAGECAQCLGQDLLRIPARGRRRRPIPARGSGRPPIPAGSPRRSRFRRCPGTVGSLTSGIRLSHDSVAIARPSFAIARLAVDLTVPFDNPVASAISASESPP